METFFFFFSLEQDINVKNNIDPHLLFMIIIIIIIIIRHCHMLQCGLLCLDIHATVSAL